MLRTTIVAALIAIGPAQPATAIPMACSTKDAMLAALKDKFGEEPMVSGDSKPSGGALTVTVAADGGFTALFIRGDMACIVFTGINWTGPRPKPGRPT